MQWLKWGSPILWVVGAVLWVYLAARMLSWMSTDSDLAVIAGVAGLTLLVLIAGAAIKWRISRPPRSLGGPMPAAVLLLASVAVMGCTRIPPGYVGIKVDNFGTQRGVQDFTIKTGVVAYLPFATSVFEYPTYTRTAIWTRSAHEGKKGVNEEISFNSKEGLIFTADISLSYSLIPEKVPAFYVKFRSDDLDHFTHGFLRNVARDAFNEVAVQYTAEEVYGDKKETILKAVRQRINDEVGQYGVHLEQFGFTEAPRPPEQVAAAINAKIKAIQVAIQVENEVRQARAQALKDVAKADGEGRAKIAVAEGEAKANAILAQSLSPTLIEWRRLALTEQAINKWDGKRPQVEGTSAGLLLNVTPRP